jgi:hypothetical protein
MQAADQIERHLSSGAELVEDRSLSAGQVVLVTGSDFTTIARTARERTREIPTDEMGGTGSTVGTTPTSGSGAGTTSLPDPNVTPTNDGTETVGVIPGQPPAGVTCE